MALLLNLSSTFCKKLSSVVCVGWLLAGTHAHALTIELNDAGLAMTAEQWSAFEKSAEIWESALSDSVTINLNVGWLPSSFFENPNTLAIALSAKTTHSWNDVRNALVVDTPYETEKFTYVLVPDPLIVEDYDVVQNGADLRSETLITMTTANAKAIGLTTPFDVNYPVPADNADAQIFFNLDYQDDWDLDDEVYAVNKGKYHFIGAAAHEIGHALGFFSATDWQDENPSDVIHPNILDIWRYQQTGDTHANSSDDPIRITAGDAEYYDAQLTNVPFSKGKGADDPYCGSVSGRCQASHWRDDSGNLMDPTAPKSKRLDLTNEDLHAFDYIGYNLNSGNTSLYSYFHLPLWDLLSTIYDQRCRTCYQKIVDDKFTKYPAPPNPAKINPPFKNANYAVLIGFDIDREGLKNRSGAGYIKFVDAMKNTISPLKNSRRNDYSDQWEQLNTGGEAIKVIPASLADFYFESDDKNGVKFFFRSIQSKAGIPFNPSLGRYGGFRVSGFIDAAGDKKRGDIDGNMTLELLLTERTNINEDFDDLSFSIDVSTEDNELKIHDFEAFGMKAPNNNAKR